MTSQPSRVCLGSFSECSAASLGITCRSPSTGSSLPSRECLSSCSKSSSTNSLVKSCRYQSTGSSTPRSCKLGSRGPYSGTASDAKPLGTYTCCHLLCAACQYKPLHDLANLPRQHACPWLAQSLFSKSQMYRTGHAHTHIMWYHVTWSPGEDILAPRACTQAWHLSFARSCSYFETVKQINEREPAMQRLTDEQLKAKTAEFKKQLDQGATLDELLIEAFAVVREVSKRVLRLRHFDAQMVQWLSFPCSCFGPFQHCSLKLTVHISICLRNEHEDHLPLQTA